MNQRFQNPDDVVQRTYRQRKLTTTVDVLLIGAIIPLHASITKISGGKYYLSLNPWELWLIWVIGMIYLWLSAKSSIRRKKAATIRLIFYLAIAIILGLLYLGDQHVWR